MNTQDGMTYKIAKTVFSLNTVHTFSHKLLADYRSEEMPEIGINTTEEDVRAERERFGETGSDGYVESLAVLRKLSDRLLDKDTLLFHGSALSVDGRCYVFAAPSGTGKSTHSRLWRELLGDRVVMVNDDKPFVSVEDTCIVYGSPWDGKERLSSNTAFPLSAICFLERSDENGIDPVDPGDAIPLLLAQTCREGSIDKVLQLVMRLADSVPMYSLCCNMSPDAARVSWGALSSAHGEEDHRTEGAQ